MLAGFPASLYGLCVAGVAMSVVLPLVRDKLPSPHALRKENNSAWNYVYIGVFSAITALILIAFARDAVNKWMWYDALIAGYAWDSTFQKMA